MSNRPPRPGPQRRKARMLRAEPPPDDLRDGIAVTVVLERFAYAPRYCAARVGDLRRMGFEVLPTGANLDHFDVQLVPGRSVEGGPADPTALASAARLMIQVAGELLPNPAYAYNEEES